MPLPETVPVLLALSVTLLKVVPEDCPTLPVTLIEPDELLEPADTARAAPDEMVVGRVSDEPFKL